MSAARVLFLTNIKMLIRLVIFLLAFQVVTAFSQNNRSRQQNQTQNRIRIAQDYERRGSYEPALRIFKELYDAVPRNQLYYEGVKRNMIRLKRFDELLSIVESQIRHTNTVRYYADLGNVYYKSSDQQQAFQTWENALTNFAKQKIAYTYIANAMITNRLYDKAIDVYLRGRRYFKTENLFVFELANIYVLRLKLKEATLEYIKHLEQFPNQFGYIESRIVNFTKDPEQARKVASILTENIAGHSQQYLIRKLVADLYLRIEEFAPALEQFRTLESMKSPLPSSRNSAGKELFFFADRTLKAGRYEFADEAFNMILHGYPGSTYRPRSLFGLAVSKQKQGLATEALQQFEALIQLVPKTSLAQNAMFQIGEIYYRNLFDLDNAEKAFRALIKNFPQNKNIHLAYFRVGDCIAARGELKDAIIWYERSLGLMKTNSQRIDEGKFKIAYLYFIEAQYDAALEKLQQITDNLGRPNINQDFVNDALELTFLIEENRSDSGEVLKLFSQAEKYTLVKNYQDAVRVLNQIVADFATSSVLDETLLSLGELENDRGNYLAAIRHFTALSDEHSESPYAALALKRVAEIYKSGLADLQKAFTAYEKFLVVYPESIYVEDVRASLRELHSLRLNN